MGSSAVKLIYTCDCGCDYGGCDRKNMFVFVNNRSVDTFDIHHQFHMDDEKSKLEHIFTLTDNSLSALIDILTERNKTALEPYFFKK